MLDRFPDGALRDEARKKAAAQMWDIYRSADKVLILDETLEAIGQERNAAELLIRICQCPWMSRLWAVQEAYLALISISSSGTALHLLEAVQRAYFTPRSRADET